MKRFLQTIQPFRPAIKWGLFLLVLAFVAWHAWTLWNRFDSAPARLRWNWLTLAGLASVVAWLPSAWFWRWIIVHLGSAAPWPQVLRAYYCGHLGKYLPGKGAVIVIRAALLKPAGVPATTAALAVTHEALTCMWAGGISTLVLYVSLAPLLPGWITARAGGLPERIALLGGLVAAGAAGLTMLLGSHQLLRGAVGGDRPAAGSTGSLAPERPVRMSWPESLRVTLAGGIVFMAAWWAHGLTLGLTIRGVVGDRAPWTDWPVWTGMAAVAMVGGFFAVFAPAGLGVREGLLMELLARYLGSREAVLVAVLWRGVTLAGEILAAGALYYGIAGTSAAAETRTGRDEESPAQAI
ncbi:MAG: flippase-like domain-containing protein [Planctomycetia bacterium]|nr:flippase-like domain-containing protein [Planctomycetia bacterium]